MKRGNGGKKPALKRPGPNTRAAFRLSYETAPYPNPLPEEERAPEAIHEPERHEGHTPSRTIPDARTNFSVLTTSTASKPPKRDSSPSAITLTKAYSWPSPSSLRTPFSPDLHSQHVFNVQRQENNALRHNKETDHTKQPCRHLERQPAPTSVNPSTETGQQGWHRKKNTVPKGEKAGELTYSAPNEVELINRRLTFLPLLG